MKTRCIKIAALGACLAGMAVNSYAQTTTHLLDLDFNSSGSFAGWGSPLLTGVPGAGVSTLEPTLPDDPGFGSGVFPTAPASGYLALTTDASAVNSGTYWGGWASNVTLATVNSLYTAGGFGQPDLSKVSLTAKVRARGMPANGAVVILEIRGSGDNPGAPTAGYRRIRFEPIFLDGNDWVTIGGTLDTAGLTAAKGSIYNFPTDAAQYSVLVELSGFNRFGASGYVAYNSPTGPSNGGRKNPGFGFTGGIRVEVDDVKLVVTDAATTGYLAPTTPDQLLRNGDFNTGNANWTFFEGAYVSTDGWSEDGSMFALIPGFGGSPYAGFMQNSIVVDPANGEFFTATFRANFQTNYRADQTIVAFMNGNGVTTFLEVDISDDIAPRLNEWHTYRATFRATPEQFAEMNGAMSLKIQPLGRTANSTPFSSALIDDIVLSQADAAAVGPQISVIVAGASHNDNETATLPRPVIGKTTPYALRFENAGAENLTISNVAISGAGFVLGDIILPINLAPGESSTSTITTSPTALGPLSGILTVTSNDKETADQSWVVNLAATAITLSDTFDGMASLEELGWFTYASSDNLWASSTFTQSNGAMILNVDSSNDDYPWLYIVSKPFASPGTIDLASSSFEIALRAFGVYTGLPHNKVQVRLESLNAAGAVTGTIELGEPVDETTAGAAPGSGAYFAADGITDRVAILLPEGGGFTTVGGSLATTGVNTNFDPGAPVFRLVVQMSDFDFDLDAGNIVEVDSITLDLNVGVTPFIVVNGGFESDATDPGTAAPPSGWLQFPPDGVSKNLVTEGDAIYNAALQGMDPDLTFSSYAGAKALKVYGQNYYVGEVWQGPSQTGTVYQTFRTDTTPGLTPGATIHARGVAKIYGVDPLSGGSSFRFGFQFLDAGDAEIGRDVATLNADSVHDRWLALVANGTVPAGAARVQVISEFVQNAASDGGAVYLDEVSAGFGFVPPSVTVSETDYELVWSDEFDGNTLNSANWTPELGTGTGGWGNGEAQSYTANAENLRVEDGLLVIEAHKTGSDWTSARIKTQGKRSFTHGKIEFRAKLPSGVGPSPAAWMMGENITEVGWPDSGEIDVMEWRGTEPNVVGHATHSPSRHGTNPISVTAPVSNPSTTFNTYAVVWEAGRVTFSVNGNNTGSWNTADTGDPFEKDFFILLNLAMGGSYLGYQIDPGLTTARYEVDYVRVYQSQETTTPLTGYQSYLASQGLPTDLAFDTDADGDGIPEGIMYAFGAASPRLGSAAAAVGNAGGTLTYLFDIRDDPDLGITPLFSDDLVNWSSGDFNLTGLSGGPDGYLRQVLTLDGSGERLFIRLVINN